MIEIRSAAEADLDEIFRIQSASPEAAQWNVAGYLSHECLVAVAEGRIAGFVTARQTAPGEFEILNLAVDPPLRRRGVARSLLEKLLTGWRGSVFLEVRQSNVAARKLYHALGFEAVAVRANYYQSTGESAIVMKFYSC